MFFYGNYSGRWIESLTCPGPSVKKTDKMYSEKVKVASRKRVVCKIPQARLIKLHRHKRRVPAFDGDRVPCYRLPKTLREKTMGRWNRGR
jgi:hypothetical protein